MEVTSLKNIKFETKEIEVLDGEFFAVKCAAIEDIIEVFGLKKEDLERASLELDTKSKLRFLITLMKTLPDFLDGIISQCVVNYDDLEMIENVLKIMSTQRKINLIKAVFDLSWDNIESFLIQMKTAQGMIEMIMEVSKEVEHT